MTIGSYEDRICLCDWNVEGRRDKIDRRICRYLKAEYEEGSSDVMAQTIIQLNEYFARTRKEFTIPVLFTGTFFQNSVWTALTNIPYGTTISYANLANRLINPKAIRAVASAIASNPISIIIPCHRVIGSNHKLTGFAGGLLAKRFLLDLEYLHFGIPD